ncbi:MAG TPA: sigma-70 family RNA polymerase sigma factor [Edaphobacter sp.]
MALTLTDHEAVTAELSGRRDEFLGFVVRRVGDRSTAEDLLQLAYTRAIERMDSLGNPEMARAWFYRILRNIVVDFYRHRAMETKLMEPMEATFDTPIEVREQANICRCMDRAVERLKPEYAQVLREVELAEDDSATIEAYARREGITPGNAAVRAFRARKAMAKSLQHTCGSCAGAGCLDCTCAEPSETVV